MRFSIVTGLTAALAIGAKAQSLPTIETKGSYFFTSGGSRWNVKGIAYQLSESDPLVNTAQCTADAALMQELGANAIRVYHVDATADHSGCMTAFANAGIYLFVDLDTFSTYIVQGSPSWTSSQESAYEAVMDEFQKYDNTAGFFIANEVLTDPAQSEVAAYVKAAVSDMKAYRNSKGYRNIPIGYSHADVSGLRPSFQDYLACGNSSEAIDFFGLNSYEWCGSSSYLQSGYQTLTQEIMSYPIPIFFSETGCNTPEPRTFGDQAAIFGPQMNPYWSGAIIYEWIQEENHYGLVTYGGDTNALDSYVPGSTITRSGTPTPVTPDFSNLMTAWATVTPTGTLQASAYTPSNTAISCPSYVASGASTWEIAGDIALPTLNEQYNSAVQYSITAGHLEGQAASSTTSGAAASGGSASGSAASASATKVSGAGKAVKPVGDMKVIGTLAALGAVFLGFAVCL